MFPKSFFLKTLRRVTESGVKSASAVEFVKPRDRMIVSHLASRKRFRIERHQNLNSTAPRIHPIIVPLVRPLPYLRKMNRRRMIPILNYNDRLLNPWMTLKITSNQSPVPIPVIFSIGRRMNSDKSSAFLNKFFKGLLLRFVQNIAGRIQENDNLKAIEILFVENRCILARFDCEIIGRTELLDSRQFSIDACRKPPVFEKTSTRKESSASFP